MVGSSKSEWILTRPMKERSYYRAVRPLNDPGTVRQPSALHPRHLAVTAELVVPDTRVLAHAGVDAVLGHVIVECLV